VDTREAAGARLIKPDDMREDVKDNLRNEISLELVQVDIKGAIKAE
jgi:hypothetical protein